MAALPFLYVLSILNMTFYHPEDPGYFSVRITGYKLTTVQLSPPWGPPHSVTLSPANNFTWAETRRLTDAELTPAITKGYRVMTSQQVSVQVSRGKLVKTSSLAYTALPLTKDGTKFMLSSQPYSSLGIPGAGPVFSVGTSDRQATVTLYRKRGSGYSTLMVRTVEANTVKEFRINEHQDITGWLLASSSPVVVYSGHQCANIPVNTRYCEPIIQAIPPMASVRKEYIVGSIQGRGSGGYTVRIIFTESNMNLWYDAKNSRFTLNSVGAASKCHLTGRTEGSLACYWTVRAGDYLEFVIDDADSPSYFVCSMPCYVYQMNHGGLKPGTSNNINTDPFMSLVPPLDFGAQSTLSHRLKFSTVSGFKDNNEFNFTNYVTIITHSESRVMLDGARIEDSSLIHSTGDWAVYTQEISHGVHQVQSTDNFSDRPVPLVVQVYGHGPTNLLLQCGYGFPASYPVDVTSSIPPSIGVTSFTQPSTTESRSTLSSSSTPRVDPISTRTSPPTRTDTTMGHPVVSDERAEGHTGWKSSYNLKITSSLTVIVVLLIVISSVIYLKLKGHHMPLFESANISTSQMPLDYAHSVQVPSCTFPCNDDSHDYANEPRGNAARALDAPVYVIPQRVTLRPPDYDKLFPQDNHAPPAYEEIVAESCDYEDVGEYSSSNVAGSDNPEYVNLGTMTNTDQNV